jgi:hypothetical protein
MSYLEFKDTIDRAHAHGLAVKGTGRRQAHVYLTFYENNAKVFAFDTCLGHCRKCDALWVSLRVALADVKVVEIRAPETAAPAQADSLGN